MLESYIGWLIEQQARQNSLAMDGVGDFLHLWLQHSKKGMAAADLFGLCVVYVMDLGGSISG